MAVQIEKPTRPINVVLKEFANDLKQALAENFTTQKIYPLGEVYPGYYQVNFQRFTKGQWYSTGEGAKSFETQVHCSTGNEAIVLRFNEYLRFVDMGVGMGTSYGDVKSERKAHHSRRYITMWHRKEGESHRPAIMMEMRHLEHRMIRYFEDFYGREISSAVLKSFEGLTPAQMFL